MLHQPLRVLGINSSIIGIWIDKEGEEWAYFTLNVKGEARFAMIIMFT